MWFFTKRRFSFFITFFKLVFKENYIFFLFSKIFFNNIKETDQICFLFFLTVFSGPKRPNIFFVITLLQIIFSVKIKHWHVQMLSKLISCLEIIWVSFNTKHKNYMRLTADFDSIILILTGLESRFQTNIQALKSWKKSRKNLPTCC